MFTESLKFEYPMQRPPQGSLLQKHDFNALRAIKEGRHPLYNMFKKYTGLCIITQGR